MTQTIKKDYLLTVDAQDRICIRLARLLYGGSTPNRDIARYGFFKGDGINWACTVNICKLYRLAELIGRKKQAGAVHSGSGFSTALACYNVLFKGDITT